MKNILSIFLCFILLTSCENLALEEMLMSNGMVSVKSSNIAEGELSMNMTVKFDGYVDSTPSSYTNEKKIWTFKASPTDANGNTIDIYNSPNSYVKVWVSAGNENFYNYPYDKTSPTTKTFIGKFGLGDIAWTEADSPSEPKLLGAFSGESLNTHYWQNPFFNQMKQKENGDIDDAVIGDEFRFQNRSRASFLACPSCDVGNPEVYVVAFRLFHNGQKGKYQKFWLSNQ